MLNSFADDLRLRGKPPRLPVINLPTNTHQSQRSRSGRGFRQSQSGGGGGGRGEGRNLLSRKEGMSFPAMLQSLGVQPF